jgi:predicted hydrocarbon binding protein
MTAQPISTPSDPNPRDPRLVVPALPLALLESVRDSDRPGEVLEDEDLTVSLPRRLGLTGVVDAQIRRYESARRWTRSVPHSELVSLYRLVLRRPDASRILFDAGRALAGMRFERTPAAAATAMRVLPRALVLGTVRRVTRRLLRSIGADRKVEVRKPLVVRLEHADIARLDDAGTACRVYTGLIEELTELYTGSDATVDHTGCMARGDAACEWTLTPPPKKEAS